jgi:hypothetical protein
MSEYVDAFLEKLPAPLDAKVKKLGWEYSFESIGPYGVGENSLFVTFKGVFNYKKGKPAPHIAIEFEYECDSDEADILASVMGNVSLIAMNDMTSRAVENTLREEYPEFREHEDDFNFKYKYVYKYVSAVNKLMDTLSAYVLTN